MQPLEYNLPIERIAKYPLENRAESKLLVYKAGQISESTYSQIAEQIPENSVIVRNISKVIKARILVPEGEIFLVEPIEQSFDRAMNMDGEIVWSCIVKNPKKILGKHNLGKGVTMKVHKDKAKDHYATFTIEEGLTMGQALENVGHMPLPPYMEREDEVGDQSWYQSTFAKKEGSVAAPTASLHFTDEIFDQLQAKGIEIIDIVLHVGLGSFRPIKFDIENHSMHREIFEVSPESAHRIANALIENKTIITVGTTAFRVIESLVWMDRWYKPESRFQSVSQWIWQGKEFMGKDELSVILSNVKKPIYGYTHIFCTREYIPQIVDAIITNFHQPQSTLLELVYSCINKGWNKVYKYAMEHDFRFLSYGDGSLLWVSRK